jgi:hypothetical protein
MEALVEFTFVLAKHKTSEEEKKENISGMM